MNRIILIGNGFDLAHGMNTSYRHFIDDYWKNCIKEIKELTYREKYQNQELAVGQRTIIPITAKNFSELISDLKKDDTQITFKNKFFQIISKKSYIENWVDIENEYYTILKNTTNKSRPSVYGSNIKALNSDFKKVQDRLVDYLNKIQGEFKSNFDSNLQSIKNIIGYKIYHPFDLNDFSEASINQRAEIEYNLLKKDIEGILENKISINEVEENKRKIIQRIDITNPFIEIRKLLQSKYARDLFDLIPDQTVFLNFNYTFTDDIYNNPKEFDTYNDKKYSVVKSIHIHGTIDSKDNNPIIFGFGDELDEEYKSLEKLNNNDYLENIKSINYLESENYKKLLEYINSGNFQVFIFGHSCGISDRTLLNTIFEHENCASIKLFFHEKSEDNDNFSDIVRNISRNFNDKAKMRDRVVNKNYSEKLR
ncbi:AbiH family protein [Lacinutrix cladophorae]